MAIHRLHIDDFEEIDYELIAIHTSLEDYRLAYFLNQQLPILLSRSKAEIQISNKQGTTSFSRFIYEDSDSDSFWSLIQNRNVISSSDDESADLFLNMQFASNVYLLPEFKKADYFLKIENSEKSAEAIIDELLSIKQIAALYSVDISKLKNKNNLIF